MTYTPFCVADRPNHLRLLQRAAARTDKFGVVVRATVTETVRDLAADLDVPLLVDNGQYASDDLDIGLLALFDRYEQMGADYALLPEAAGDRIENSRAIGNCSRVFERGATSRWSFQPVAVAQGTTVSDYQASYWDAYQMGADAIAIGGLLSTIGNRSGGHATGRDDLVDVLTGIRDVHPRIWESTWTFALGCDHPRRRPVFQSLGVAGADAKRWLFQYDNAAVASREDQLVDEVVDAATVRTPPLAAYTTEAP